MSIEFGGDGAECAECGEFDFLAFTCPRCGGRLCRHHTQAHHRPADGAPCTADNRRADAEGGDGAPASFSGAVCCRCGSELCALRPCPGCGRNFCAAHRFHECQRDTASASAARPGLRRAAAPQAAAAGAQPASGLQALCGASDRRHPRQLVAASHKGGSTLSVDLLVFACGGGGQASSPASPVAVADAAVWSCVVPAMVVVGQWLLPAAEEACRAVWPSLTQAQLAPAARASRLCRVTAAAPGTSSRDAPALQWAVISPSERGREALATPGLLVLVLPEPAPDPAQEPVTAQTNDTLTAGLTAPLTSLLFSPSAAEFRHLAKDARIKAAATHLRLAAQRLARTQTQ